MRDQTQSNCEPTTLSLQSSAPLQVAEDRQLWERQPDESDQHWGWFEIYRNLHPSVRTIAKAYAIYKEQDTPEALSRTTLALRAPSWFEAIATQNQWTYRARAFDEWADADLLERLQATRVRHLIEVADIGRRLRNKAAEALAVLETVTFEVIIDEDGNPKTIEIAALTPGAIAQLARLGVDLERDALGMGRSGQVGGVTVNVATVVGGQATSRLPNPLGDDELLERVSEIVRHRQTQTEPSASVELPGRGDDRNNLITVEARPVPDRPAVKAKPKPKATETTPKAPKPHGISYEPHPGGQA